MPFLVVMPDISWTVKVGRWTWIYTFKNAKGANTAGSVTWRDPWNGKHGKGAWRIVDDEMKIDWSGSDTKETWDRPFEPRHTTGTCVMDGTSYDLTAVARDFFLGPGDVVNSGAPLIRCKGFAATVIYENEVRTGGTVAWVCCNPGNIRNGDAYGAIAGKRLRVPGIGEYSIFPDENAGLMAVFKVLRVYGRVTIAQAIAKYAPMSDHNNTEGYIKSVTSGMKMPADTYLTTMSDEQVMRMAMVMTGVETTTPGYAWARGDAEMPLYIAMRLKG